MNLKDKTVAIIDDDAGTLKLLGDILKNEGFRVRQFNNGAFALRSIEADLPEIILLDMCMPIMNGIEICKELKQNPKIRHVPVIFITGLHEMEYKIKGFQVGGADYITKPFQKQEVIARVKVHIALHCSFEKIKRISEELEKNKKKLEIAQKIAQLGHWEWNTKTDEIELSDGINHILGLNNNLKKITLEQFIQFIHTDDKIRVLENMRKVVPVDECDSICDNCISDDLCHFECEYRIILPNGETRIIQSKGKYLNSQNTNHTVVGTVQDETVEFTRIKMLGIAQDITRQKELELKLEEQATTDFLTGCYNRRRFLEFVQNGFDLFSRYSDEMSLLMLDLDLFKNVNDTYGHAVGDLVLIKLVEICQAELRNTDIVGRYGGEEFVVMLPKTSNVQAFELAERLCKVIANTKIITSNIRFNFTTSIGLSTLKSTDKNVDNFIKRADEALYQAKHSGRNCVVNSG